MSEKSKKGRSLRPVLSVRNLMLLVLLIGGGFGWLLQKPMAQARAIRAIHKQGGGVGEGSGNLGCLVAEEPKSWIDDWKERIGPEYFMQPTYVGLKVYADDELLEEVSHLDRVTSIEFKYCELLSVKGLARIGRMSSLEAIELRRGKIEKTALSGLAKLPRLKRLVISSHDLSDDDLAPIAMMTGLEELSLLQCTQLTDEGMKSLSSLPKLRILKIDGCPFTSEALVHIGKIHSLKNLSIYSTSICDISPLSSLENLESLSLVRNRLEDQSLARIANLPKLAYVNLSVNSIRLPGIVTGLGRLNWTRLDLSGTELSDEGLAQLVGLTNLKYLTLDGIKITDVGLRSLTSMKNLKGIGLRNTTITDASLEFLCLLPELKSLDLCKTSVTDRGLKTLEGLNPGSTVSLYDTKTTSAGVALLQSRNPSLQIDAPGIRLDPLKYTYPY